MIPKADTDNFAQFNDLSLNTAYVDPIVGNLPEILEVNTSYDLGLCVGTLDQSGWNGISDHGDLNQCISVTSNYPNVTYGDLTGSWGSTSPTIDVDGNANYVLPPNTVFNSECALMNFDASGISP